MKNLTIRNEELKQLNRLIAVACLLMAGLVYFFSPWLAGIAIFIPYYLTKEEGVEIDPVNRQIRHYKSFWGRRRGPWKSMELFRCFVVLSKRGSKTMPRKGNADYVTAMNYFELYLMNALHTTRFFVHATDNEENLRLLITRLEHSTGLPLERFHPQTDRFRS